MKIVFLMLLLLSPFLFHISLAARPSVVSIGSILRFNSTTGGVAAVAIRAALEDINSDPTVLNGTTLRVDMRDTNCDDGFLGMVEGRTSLIPPPFVLHCFIVCASILDLRSWI